MSDHWHRLTEVDIESGTGVCSICGPTRVRIRAGGRKKECWTRRVQHRKSSSPSSRRRWKYGLSEDAWQEMTSRYDGLCWICREDRANFVDHDHRCCPGEKTCGDCVRGALCRSCNTAIGLLGDDPDRVVRAASYLRGSLKD